MRLIPYRSARSLRRRSAFSAATRCFPSNALPREATGHLCHSCFTEGPATRNAYRVTLTSIPGMYAQYDGNVTVWSHSDEPAVLFQEAVRELCRTSFRNRRAAMWRLECVEHIPCCGSSTFCV
jgi:hypothetical protein